MTLGSGNTPSTATTTLLLHRQNAVTSRESGVNIPEATDIIISVGDDDSGCSAGEAAALGGGMRGVAAIVTGRSGH